jgi:hypothetical protein
VLEGNLLHVDLYTDWGTGLVGLVAISGILTFPSDRLSFDDAASIVTTGTNGWDATNSMIAADGNDLWVMMTPANAETGARPAGRFLRATFNVTGTISAANPANFSWEFLEPIADAAITTPGVYPGQQLSVKHPPASTGPVVNTINRVGSGTVNVNGDATTTATVAFTIAGDNLTQLTAANFSATFPSGATDFTVVPPIVLNGTGTQATVTIRGTNVNPASGTPRAGTLRLSHVGGTAVSSDVVLSQLTVPAVTPNITSIERASGAGSIAVPANGSTVTVRYNIGGTNLAAVTANDFAVSFTGTNASSFMQVGTTSIVTSATNSAVIDVTFSGINANPGPGVRSANIVVARAGVPATNSTLHVEQAVHVGVAPGIMTLAFRTPTVAPGALALLDFNVANNPGFGNMSITIPIPDGFGTPVLTTPLGAEHIPAGSIIQQLHSAPRRLVVTFMGLHNIGDYSPTANFTGNGTIFTVQMMAPATPGPHHVVLPTNLDMLFRNYRNEVDHPTRRDGTPVNFLVAQATNGENITLTVDPAQGEVYRVGDVNGDGRLTSRDATLIAMYMLTRQNNPNDAPAGMMTGGVGETWRRPAANTRCDDSMNFLVHATHLAQFLVGQIPSLCVVTAGGGVCQRVNCIDSPNYVAP